MPAVKSSKPSPAEKPWLHAKEALRIFEDHGLTYDILFELGKRGKVDTRPDPANSSCLLYERRGLRSVLILPKNRARARQIGQQFPNVTPSEVNYYRTHPCAVLKDHKGNPRTIKTKPDPLHVARYLYWVPDLQTLDDLPTVNNWRVAVDGVARRPSGGSRFRGATLARWRKKCNSLPEGKLDSIYLCVRLKTPNYSRIQELYLDSAKDLAIIRRKKRAAQKGEPQGKRRRLNNSAISIHTLQAATDSGRLYQHIKVEPKWEKRIGEDGRDRNVKVLSPETVEDAERFRRGEVTLKVDNVEYRPEDLISYRGLRRKYKDPKRPNRISGIIKSFKQSGCDALGGEVPTEFFFPEKINGAIRGTTHWLKSQWVTIMAELAKDVDEFTDEVGVWRSTKLAAKLWGTDEETLHRIAEGRRPAKLNGHVAIGKRYSKPRYGRYLSQLFWRDGDEKREQQPGENGTSGDGNTPTANTADDGPKPAPAETATAVVESKPKRERFGWVVEAMKLVNKHPGWSDRKIATAVNRSHSQLSRCNEYQLAASVARGDKSVLPRGYRTTGGGIEAYNSN